MFIENEEEIKQYIRDKREYFKEDLNIVGLFNKVTDLIDGDYINKHYPASLAHHHAYDGGLLEHTYEVMKICEHIASVKRFDTYDTDKLLFLALIHDLGKMNEYKYDFEKRWYKTDFGSHIEYGYYKVFDYNKTQAKRLAAHHGKKEWGALFEPFDKISWALHLADMISAKCE